MQLYLPWSRSHQSQRWQLCCLRPPAAMLHHCKMGLVHQQPTAAWQQGAVLTHCSSKFFRRLVYAEKGYWLVWQDPRRNFFCGLKLKGLTGRHVPHKLHPDTFSFMTITFCVRTDCTMQMQVTFNCITWSVLQNCTASTSTTDRDDHHMIVTQEKLTTQCPSAVLTCWSAPNCTFSIANLVCCQVSRSSLELIALLQILRKVTLTGLEYSLETCVQHDGETAYS